MQKVKAGQKIKVNIMGSITTMQTVTPLENGYWRCQVLGISSLSYSNIHESQFVFDQ